MPQPVVGEGVWELDSENESKWRVTDIDLHDPHSIVVHTDFGSRPTGCPRCGSLRRPRRYGDLEVNYRDAPFLGHVVTIAINIQRFRCHDCGGTFFQNLTDLDGKRRMTARCANYVVEQVVTRSSMGDVAHIIGVDEKTVRNVFEDRGLVFEGGHPLSSDHLVCESCLGLRARDEMRLVAAGHFGRWRKLELRPDINVCPICFDYMVDAWRAGVVKRLR